MNKLFKGAIAGAAGVALLLGGAGTFALWNDAGAFGPNNTITSGHLRFGTGSPSGSWTLNGEDVDPEAVIIVPGDVLVYSMTGLPIIAEGTNLTAELALDYAGSVTAADDDPASAELVDALTTQFLVNDVPTNTVEVTGTTANGGVQNIDVEVQLTFDPGDKSDGQLAQGGAVNLNAFHLTLTQTLDT